MHGLHLTADLRGCSPAKPVMTEPSQLRDLCLAAVREAGLRPVGELFHRFAPVPGVLPPAPVGVTGVVLLAESHLAVHTWPELGAVTVDVYVCNLQADNSHLAHIAIERLIAGFAASQVTRQTLLRGGSA